MWHFTAWHSFHWAVYVESSRSVKTFQNSCAKEYAMLRLDCTHAHRKTQMQQIKKVRYTAPSVFGNMFKDRNHTHGKNIVKLKSAVFTIFGAKIITKAYKHWVHFHIHNAFAKTIFTRSCKSMKVWTFLQLCCVKHTFNVSGILTVVHSCEVNRRVDMLLWIC